MVVRQTGKLVAMFCKLLCLLSAAQVLHLFCKLYLEEVNQVVDCTANVQVWLQVWVLPFSLHSERSGHSVSYGYRTAHPLRVSPLLPHANIFLSLTAYHAARYNPPFVHLCGVAAIFSFYVTCQDLYPR